ncbi:uncharacterized protein LOC141619017 [Silene latifolia]|uniref:uncharacterized protein LOC141619017 n=1 Tax=Silene latifolia TaxID=37657 RepID=UPI003D773FE6
MKWEKCCTPKEEGGLGLKNVHHWNKALLGKYTACLSTKKDHLWVKWVNHVYMKGTEWQDYSPPLDCSWSWKKIVHVKDKFKHGWLRSKTGSVPWRFMCWNPLNVPKTTFILWEAQQNRLLTLDKLIKMGMGQDSICFICGLEPETHSHLFYNCNFSKQCMQLLQAKLHIHFSAETMVHWFFKNRSKSALQKIVTAACFVGVTYAI